MSLGRILIKFSLPLQKFLFLSLISSFLYSKIDYSANIIKYNQKSKEVILRGNAKAKKENNHLNAKKITLYEDLKMARAKGKVYFYNNKKGFYFYSEKADYYYEKKKLYAWDQCKLISKEENTEMKSDFFYYDIKKEYSYALTNVFIDHKKSNDVQIEGKKAEYFLEDKLFVVTNNCKVVMSNITGFSDLIYLQENKQELDFVGNTKMNFLNSEGNTNYLKAERLIYYYGENEKMSCISNVSLIDVEEETKIYSEYLDFYPDDGYTYVYGNSKMTNEKENYHIESDSFERFSEKKLLYAKGNVIITTESSKARSSIAVVQLENNKVVLYGNPYLLTEQGNLKAEKIYIDTKNQKINLENQIYGSIFQTK